MQIHNIPPWVTLAYVTAVFAATLWRGDAPLRLVAFVIWFPSLVYYGPFYYDGAVGFRLYPGVQDVVGFSLCLAFAMAGRKWWSIWAAAGFLLALVTRLVFWLNPGIGPWAFGSAQLVWYYVSATAVLFGALARPRPRGPASR